MATFDADEDKDKKVSDLVDGMMQYAEKSAERARENASAISESEPGMVAGPRVALSKAGKDLSGDASVEPIREELNQLRSEVGGMRRKAIQQSAAPQDLTSRTIRNRRGR